MNQVIASDQSLRLVVAIEKAIDDSRFDVRPWQLINYPIPFHYRACINSSHHCTGSSVQVAHSLAANCTMLLCFALLASTREQCRVFSL